MNNFKGKIVLVTGGAKGIGKAITIDFLEQGAFVICLYNKSKKEIEILEKNQKYEDRLLAIKCDLQNVEEVLSIYNKIPKEYQQIDILINNAGVKIKSDFLNTTPDIWEKTMSTNLQSPYFLSQLFAKEMITRRSGKIINIASQAGVCHVTSSIEYGLSKSGLIYITKSLAKKLAPFGINVNAVSPGRTYTDMTDYKNNPEKETEDLKNIPLGIINLPEDISKVVLFLASDLAKNITGQIISIDGGECLS